MARKAFAVNDAVRERVRYLAGVGVPQDGIAKIIGCAPKTLRKRFRDDLDRGVAEATATVSGFLFAAAKGGSISAIIFWLVRSLVGPSIHGCEPGMALKGRLLPAAFGPPGSATGAPRPLPRVPARVA